MQQIVLSVIEVEGARDGTGSGIIRRVQRAPSYPYARKFALLHPVPVPVPVPGLMLVLVLVLVPALVMPVLALMPVRLPQRAMAVRAEAPVQTQMQIGQQLEARDPQQHRPQRERATSDVVASGWGGATHGLDRPAIHSIGHQGPRWSLLEVGTWMRARGIVRHRDLPVAVVAYAS